MVYIYLGLRTGLLRISNAEHLTYFVEMPTTLPADANLNSPQIKLINEWNEGFSALNVDLLVKPLHKDFRRVVYPKSIGNSEQNKDEWIQELTVMFGFATEIDVRYAPCYSNSLAPG